MNKLQKAVKDYNEAKGRLEKVREECFPTGELIALPLNQRQIVGRAIGVGMCPDRIAVKVPKGVGLPDWLGEYYDVEIERAVRVECQDTNNDGDCQLCHRQGGCPLK